MLAQYIRDLLYRYECVIIPDFGGLLTHTVSAKIDPDNHTFSPPSKKLSFNAQLKESDGLLANYIASVDHISLESAQNYIQFEVDEWREKLKKQDLELADIGVFSLDSVENIRFEPNSKSNFLTDSFGLTEIEMPEVERVESEQIPMETIEMQAPVDIKPKTKKRKKQAQSAWISFLQYGAIFALVFAIGWFFVQQIIENNASFKKVQALQESQDIMILKHIQEAIFEVETPLRAVTLKVVRNTALDTIFPNEKALDSTKVQVQLKPENVPSNPTQTNPINPNTKTQNTVTKQDLTSPAANHTVTTPAKSNSEQVNPNATRYYIIAGAFKDSKNAIDLVKTLRGKGYNAIIVNKTSDVNLVSYDLYSSLNNAEKALEKISVEDPEAWILSK